MPITACNFTDQPVITPSGCYRNGPEITCNTDVETGSITSESPGYPSSERGTLNIEEYVFLYSLSFDEMLGLDDPAADRCPACGSRVVMPTLLEPGEWECWEQDCKAIWTVER